MPDNTAQVQNLIDSFEFKDARIADLLRILSSDLYSLERQINPPTDQSATVVAPGADTVVVTVPGSFVATVFNNDIRLNWTTSTSPGGILLYEIRLGSTYATASILLTTATLSADIDPVSRVILTNATYTFWIVAVDNSGNRSLPASVAVAVPNISAPTITPTVFQNYVLLNWTSSTSTFVIDHYIVYRNGVVYGNSHGNFVAIFEVAAGTYTYSVQAVDIVGNLGTPSNVISVLLTAPPNFIQLGNILSTFTGTKVNCALDIDNTKLIAPVNSLETWNDHFAVNNSWPTIQDQINAGYPFYAEPSKPTATYTETFDFGAIFTNSIIALSYNFTLYTGSVAITFTISVSTDNILFDTPAAGNTRFATAARYVKVVVTFTPAPADKSLVDFLNFSCNLNVHQDTDSGTISALATDASGTPIVFNKPFKVVQVVVLTPQTSTTAFAVYNNLTATGCNVFVYDNAGVRISKTVTWQATGVV